MHYALLNGSCCFNKTLTPHCWWAPRAPGAVLPGGWSLGHQLTCDFLPIWLLFRAALPKEGAYLAQVDSHCREWVAFPDPSRSSLWYRIVPAQGTSRTGPVLADLHLVSHVCFTQGYSHLPKVTRTCLEALLLSPGPFVAFHFFFQSLSFCINCSHENNDSQHSWACIWAGQAPSLSSHSGPGPGAGEEAQAVPGEAGSRAGLWGARARSLHLMGCR